MVTKTTAFLGLDQGTSATKGIVISEGGEICAERSYEVPTPEERNGVMVQDPGPMARTLSRIVKELNAECSSLDLRALGLSCQRSGILAWKEDGSIVHPVMSWQDFSTAPFIESIRSHHQTISYKSGIPVSPNRAGAKFHTLLENYPSALVGDLDSYLSWILTGGEVFSIESSHAARSQLMNLDTLQWDPELCKLFAVDSHRLPAFVPSLSNHGSVEGLPFLARLGDGQAGYWGLTRGRLVPNLILGTIASLISPTGASPVRLPGYFSSILLTEGQGGTLNRKEYYLEATTASCGQVMNLIVEKLGLIQSASEISDLCAQGLAQDPDGAVTALTALGNTACPHWKSDLPDVLVGANLNGGPSVARALVESVGSYVVYDLLEFARAANITISSTVIPVSGGVARCDYLLQYLADCTGFSFKRTASEKGSAFGAAILAMMGAGIDPQSLPEEEGTIFLPQKSNALLRYEKWNALRERVYSGNVDAKEIIHLR